MIVEVSLYHGPQPFPELRHVPMSASSKLLLQRSQPQHGSHGDNLCFLIDSSPDCAQDEDLCERLAELVVTGSNSMVLPSHPCPDGDCSIEIGIP